MIKLFFRTLYSPLFHYLLLSNTRKTLDFAVTCISYKMTLFVNSKKSTIFIFITMNEFIKNNIIIQII